MIRTIAILALSAVAALPAAAQVDQGRKNVPEFEPAFENQTRAPQIRDVTRLDAERIATGLVHPWGIAVLPEGGYLVTERIGQLAHIDAQGTVTRIDGVPEVWARGQGGMLDVAVAPDFAETRRVYLTYSKPRFRGSSTTAATGVLSEDATELTDIEEIFVQEPSVRAGAHFGSRIVISGDSAFVTIGDRGVPENAQDLGATIGKVVRITLEGKVPDDNPFVDQSSVEPEIFSYGHRNPQGAALHPETGELWTLEHGPKGGDELNRIQPGANYGWPLVSYGEEYSGVPIGPGQTSAEGIVEPRYYWDPVIAPGGFTFYTGDLIPGWEGDVVAASLKPGGIVRLKLDGDQVTGEARYLRDLGRVRDIDIDLDGALLLVTDDPDGGLYRVTPR